MIGTFAVCGAWLLSGAFTWADELGDDALIVLQRGDLSLEIVTDRFWPNLDWRDVYDPEIAPELGWTTEQEFQLNRSWPALSKTAMRGVGEWWEARLPLWVLMVPVISVGLVRFVRRRFPRWQRSRRDADRAAVTPRRAWSKGGKRVFVLSVLACVIIGSLWLASTRWYVGYFCSEDVVELARCALIVRTVPEPEQELRGEDIADEWETFSYGAAQITWELPHSAFFAQGLAGYWTELVIPLWLLFLLSAAPGVVLLWRHRRRRVPGFCRKCGYDLTGNVSGRCPECGVTCTDGADMSTAGAGR